MIHQTTRQVETDLLKAFHRREIDRFGTGSGEGIGTAVKLVAEVTQRDGPLDVLSRPGLDFPPQASMGRDGGLLPDVRIDGGE